MSLETRIIGLGIALAACFTVTTMAAEQNPPQSGGSRENSTGNSFGIDLLRSELVQKDLKLTDQQKTKLQEMNEQLIERRRREVRERFSGVDGLNEEGRRELQRQMQQDRQKRTDDARKQIAAILTPDQQKRLRQIELQQEGPICLLRPEVAETVGISEQQKTQLEQIDNETKEKLKNLIQEARAGDSKTRNERMERLQEKARGIRDDGEGKAMALLSPEQKKKLIEMMGEPFKMERLSPLPRRAFGWGTRSSHSTPGTNNSNK